MNEAATSFLESQCWTCPVFDRLFEIISNVAGAVYGRMVAIGIIIFCVLIGFYIINAVWQNIKRGVDDPFLQQSAKPVVIKSILVLTLLLMGITLPKLISQLTFEPVAVLTLQFTKAITPDGISMVSNYSPIDLGTNGFFNVQLRDTLLELIQISVANFQIYVKIGLEIIESAFCLRCLFGIGSLIRHIIIFFIGIFLTYNFVKLFIKYSFCFMDVIVAMAMFAFFFPLAMIFFIFKDAKDLPDWMKSLGSKIGPDQLKKLINAIVSIASAILTYTIIMMIIRGYLSSNGVVATESMSYESLFDFDLENSTAMQITFAGAIVLVYVIRYISDQVPKITQKIMAVFGVSQEDELSKKMGEDMWQLTNTVKDSIKDFAKTVINPDSATKSAASGAAAASGAKK